MMASLSNARKIIKANYTPEFQFKIYAKECTIGVRPVYETLIGLPTLCWTKNVFGGTMVRIGKLLPGGGIDWMWENDKALK